MTGISTHSPAKLEKIQAQLERLVALVEHPGTPDAERQVASEQMERLIAKYAITEAISSKDATNSRDIYTMDFDYAGPYNNLRHTLMSVIADALGCRYTWKMRTKTGTIYGLLKNIELAWLLYQSLEEQMDRNRQDGRIDTDVTSQRSYMYGFSISLGERLTSHYAEALNDLSESDRTKGELVLVSDAERIDAKLYEKTGGAKIKSTSTSKNINSAVFDGIEDGNKANINTGAGIGTTRQGIDV